MRNILASLLLSFCAGTLVGQTDSPALRWFGDVRVRAELDMRDFKEKTPANGYTLLRSRLGVEARPLENVRVLLQLRDSRVFGQERDGTGAFNTVSDTRNLDLHQGYVELKKFPVDAMTLKVGRQEVSYGNERIIGAVGWNNIGRSFDGGILRSEFNGVTLDLLAFKLAEVQQYAPTATVAAVQYARDAGADLLGLYGTTKEIPNNTLDGYLLHQTDRNQTVAGSNDLSRWTLGGLVRGNFPAINYDLEVAYQTGSRRGLDVSAYLLAGSLSYTFEGSPVRRLGLGYERLSGSIPASAGTGSTRHGSFDPMFHTGHKFYGFMDYFVSFPANTADRGLIDAYGKGTVNITQAVTLNLWVHYFGQETDSRVLGHEADCVVSHRLNDATVLEGGVAAFLPGRIMRDRFGGASTGFWGFLALAASF